MSFDEFLVIGFGLFVGYWVVSKLILGDKKPAVVPQQQPQAPGVPEEPAPIPWHEVLQVSPEADAAEVRRAYQSLIGQYHPDKVAALGEELRTLAERKSAQINAAYQEAQRALGTP